MACMSFRMFEKRLVGHSRGFCCAWRDASSSIRGVTVPSLSICGLLVRRSRNKLTAGLKCRFEISWSEEHRRLMPVHCYFQANNLKKFNLKLAANSWTHMFSLRIQWQILHSQYFMKKSEPRDSKCWNHSSTLTRAIPISSLYSNNRGELNAKCICLLSISMRNMIMKKKNPKKLALCRKKQ